MESSYSERSIQQGDKQRIIEEPSIKLKKAQKRLKALLGRIIIPNFVHNLGYRRSYVTNARSHVNGCIVKSLDIKKFFPSTPSRKVYYFFYSFLQCPTDIAAILTKLVTYKGHLPTGSPSSSVIAYYAYLDMWNNIEAISKSSGCTLTIYADDITVSGSTIPKGLIWEIKKQIHKHGLDYHKSKFYEGKKPKSITGVITLQGQLKAQHCQHLKRYNLKKELKENQDKKYKEKLIQKLGGINAQIEYIRKLSPTSQCEQ
ncbi:MAG: RNA-directed DNA polymerase [Spirulina sp. SIO3F2]|nr:RNA-directed DNA polymerase [Spirulina sp. SIO3F2]